MILAALNNYYQRLQKQGIDIPVSGYSLGKISFALIISPGGDVVDVADLRQQSGKKLLPTSLTIPRLGKPTSGVNPDFMWGKTGYLLGVGSKDSKRIEKEYAEFRDYHRSFLDGCTDPSLQALLKFLKRWKPEQFQPPLFNAEMLDSNLVFRLDGQLQYLHDLPAAQAIWSRLQAGTDSKEGMCLVTGQRQSLARLHLDINGVKNAHTAGAKIVSFNKESSCSYGKEQGGNAPVSEQVVFCYATALNHLLRVDGKNHQRLQLGDATTVFWAESSENSQAHAAEVLFWEMLNPPADDASETERLRQALAAVASGRALRELNPEMEDDTRLYVLGLSPSDSRLSIRFWETGSLHSFALRLAEHFQDLALQPQPWKTEPAMWRLLHATAPSRDGKSKAEDIPPQLAGELTRAILTGSRYPRSLLNTIIMRLRADGDISGTRVALCKAVLARDLRLGVKGINEEIPMSLDKEASNPGYRLGRLFAVLESAQHHALGGKVNATIRDRYYGAASATPATVFPMLLRNTQNHLSKVRKEKPGLAVTLEKEISEIIDGLPPQFPRSLRLEDQGRFAIGYYHQSQARFGHSKDEDADTTESTEQGAAE